jgi:hypothetical protein
MNSPPNTLNFAIRGAGWKTTSTMVLGTALGVIVRVDPVFVRIHAKSVLADRGMHSGLTKHIFHRRSTGRWPCVSYLQRFCPFWP